MDGQISIFDFLNPVTELRLGKLKDENMIGERIEFDKLQKYDVIAIKLYSNSSYMIYLVLGMKEHQWRKSKFKEVVLLGNHGIREMCENCFKNDITGGYKIYLLKGY